MELASGPWDVMSPVWRLQVALKPSLTAFAPRVLDERPGIYYDQLADINTSLYEICCLQLFNHIAENATYRTCAGCGRPFSPKRPNQTHCTPACNRRARQRAYKRRRAAATRASHPQAPDRLRSREPGTNAGSVTDWPLPAETVLATSTIVSPPFSDSLISER